MFNIEDLEFTVTSAILDAYIDDESSSLVWGLRIEAYPDNKELPRVITFESEILFSTPPFQLKQLTDFDKTISWSEPEDEDGKPYALLYLFSHTPVCNGTVKLFKDSVGNLTTHITAQCDLHWKENYFENLNLEIKSPVTFNNILMGRDSEEKCWKNIERYFHNTKEIFLYKRDEYGVSMLIPKE